MIKWNGESRIWRQYFKEVHNTTEYPGYKYIYFTGERDADLFFSDSVGDEWRSQDWVRFFLRRRLEHDERIENRRGQFSFDEHTISNGCITNYYVRDPSNYEYLVKHYVKKCKIHDVEDIASKLKSKGYSPDYNKVRSYVNKYHKTARQENPDRKIIAEFIKYYNGLGFSSRRIEKELLKDDIHMSYRHIQRIIKEIEDVKD